MAIIVALAIAIICSFMAYQLSKGKSEKRKYIIWGITIMVAIAPSVSFSIGLIYAIIVRNGWAALIMWCLFPILFIIGLIMVFIGIFKKGKTEAI